MLLGRYVALAFVAAALVSCDAISAARRAFADRDAPHVETPEVAPAPKTTASSPREVSAEVSAVSAAASTPAPSADEEDAGEFATGDPSYREDDCENLPDISALAGAYRSGHPRATVEGIASARYAMGLAFLRAQDDTQLKAWFMGAPDSFEGIGSRFEAAIHEGSHIWRAKRFNGRTELFPVRGDLTIQTRRLTNFHRSEIRSVHVDAQSDVYAKIYLEGPSGAQGFSTLLDEYQAYAHSLASRYCTRDLVPRGSRVSARDGILTMMYYVEAYLMLGRERHPRDYAAIVADPGHRRLILTVWDRAELWLRRSRGEHALGINDRRIATWVYEPSRLAEIRRIREQDAAAAREDGGPGR